MNLSGKTILITGADGFIGSHLAETLVARGCRPRSLCLYNSFQSCGWLDSLPREILSRMEVIHGDVRDTGSIRRAMKGIQVVFHLAALIGIPYSYDCPDSYLETNVRGTLNILQEATMAKVEKILVTSTSEVYGSARYVPIDEQHPLQAQSPYSASKIAADKLAQAWHCSFGSPVAIVRPFNTYGPRQSARAVIPTIITQLLDGDRRIHLGDLSPRRDLNYVEDICEGFIAMAESDSTIGQEVNIASGREIAIGELAKMIIDQINPAAEIVLETDRIRPPSSEVQRLLGCNRRIRELTGWVPKVRLEDGLHKTIEWFRRNHHLFKSGAYQK